MSTTKKVFWGLGISVCLIGLTHKPDRVPSASDHMAQAPTVPRPVPSPQIQPQQSNQVVNRYKALDNKLQNNPRLECQAIRITTLVEGLEGALERIDKQSGVFYLHQLQVFAGMAADLGCL